MAKRRSGFATSVCGSARCIASPDFAEAFSKVLNDPAVHAGEPVLGAIASDVRRVKADENKEGCDRTRTDSMAKLADWIGQRLTLLGDSNSLRARIQLDYVDPLQNAIVDRAHKAYEYNLVEPDYQFNLDCLRVAARLFRSARIEGDCYLAQERTDVPPLMDPAGEQRFNEQLQREAKSLSVPFVLDARRVVPNENWGWEYDSPEPVAFTENRVTSVFAQFPGR